MFIPQNSNIKYIQQIDDRMSHKGHHDCNLCHYDNSIYNNELVCY